MEKEKLMKILVIIGAILIFIMGMIELTSFFSNILWITSLGMAIIFIIIALVLLFMTLFPGKPIPFNPAILLLIGIITVIISIFPWFEFLSMIGGILVLIAAILGYALKQ